MSQFSSLGLSKDALEAIDRLGYSEPTPVQEKAIPAILEGKDVIAAASTGTGKTAAFLLPTISSLSKVKKGRRSPRILVITPTRELAQQISAISFKIAKACHQYTTVVYGGSPYSKQIRELKEGTDILIATPGRLVDLLSRKSVNLSHIEVLILDEADRMLDMGFLPDVTKIVDLIPQERQTLLFSATIDASIKNNLGSLLHDPEIIQIAQRGETAKDVAQFIVPVASKEKPDLLKALLDEKGHDKVIIFARTKARAEDVCTMLNDADFEAVSIHSNKTQGQRREALQAFRKGKVGIIVATDVLARGIDVPSVDYVVNYDLPDMAEDYIHRIGRTGRAGMRGFAVSFVSPNSIKPLEAIEALLGKTIQTMDLESFDVDRTLLKRRAKTQHRASTKGSSKHSGKKANTGSASQKGAAAKKRSANYNYTGWSDLRKGKKKVKDLPKEEREALLKERPKTKGKASRTSARTTHAAEAKRGSGRLRASKTSESRRGSNTRSKKQAQPVPRSQRIRPGMKSSGLRNGGSKRS